MKGSNATARIAGFFLAVMLPVFSATQGLFSQQLFNRNFQPGYQIDGNKITAMTEDSRGFVFLGVRGGVYGFDGVAYHPLPFPDSLKHYDVSMLADAGQQLFAGLSSGALLCWTNTGMDQLPELLMQAGAPVTDMVFNSRHTWISTYGNGIWFRSEVDDKSLFTKVDKLPDESVYDLHADDAGKLWAATDGGLLQISSVDGAFEIAVFGPTEGLPDLLVTCLYLDEENQLWLGFQDGGFCSFDPVSHQAQRIKAAENWQAGRVIKIIRLENYLWMSTAGQGMLAYHLYHRQLMAWPENETAELPQRIFQLTRSTLRGFWMAGPEKIIWTTGRQIELHKQINGLNSEATTALFADSRNRLWWSNEGGLFVCDNTGIELTKARKIALGPAGKATYASSIWEDSKGNIWVGTLDEGVFMLDGNDFSIQHFTEKDGLVNNNVLSVSGKGNQLWFATLGGLSVAEINPAGKLVFLQGQAAGAGTNYIYDVLADHRNNLWIATDGQGIRKVEKGRHVEVLPDSLRREVVYTLEEAADGAIWAAIPEKGLVRLKNDSLWWLRASDGLSSTTITSIIQTASPYLIAVGYDGFNLINAWTGKVVRGSKHYGLPSAQSGLGVVTNAADGTVFIGTIEGILRLESIGDLANREPLIQLRRITANLEAIDYSRPISLLPDQRQVSVSFAGLWYPQPEQIRFRVSLSGRDTTTFETRDQTLHFGKLDAGVYKLGIQEADAENNGEALEIDFTIRKPLWQQTWFIILFLIAGAGLIYYWIKAREAKINARQRLLREKSEFEYRNLRSQVNPHFLFNSFSTLIALIENQGNDAVAYVEKLSDFFRQILEHRDDTFITISEELQLLQTYLFLQQKRYGKGFVARIELPDAVLPTLIPPMTLQMLAENALKHNIASKDNPLELRIYFEENMVVVSNKLQLRSSKEASTGLGLRNIRERYQTFAGLQPTIEQTDKSFRVLLPPIKSH